MVVEDRHKSGGERWGRREDDVRRKKNLIVRDYDKSLLFI
jgi:hypothetical protein